MQIPKLYVLDTPMQDVFEVWAPGETDRLVGMIRHRTGLWTSRGVAFPTMDAAAFHAAIEAGIDLVTN